MARGKKPHSDPPKSVHIVLPESLFVEIKVLLADPLTGRVAYGSLSSLVAKLLKTWIAERRKEYKETGISENV